MTTQHTPQPVMKTCVRPSCGAILPATPDYFYVRNPATGTLRIECVCCTRDDARRRFLADPERHRKLVAANKLRLKAERASFRMTAR